MSDHDLEQRRLVSRLFDEACAAMERENWADAIAMLEQVMDVAPDFPGAGWRHREAQKWYRVDKQFELGRKRMNDGRWREALNGFRGIQREVGEYKNTSVLIRICERQIVDAGSQEQKALSVTPEANARMLAPAGLTAMVVFGCFLIWLSSTLIPTATPPVAIAVPTETPTTPQEVETPIVTPEETSEPPAPETTPAPNNTPAPVPSISGGSPNPPIRRTPTPTRRTSTATPTRVAATRTPTRTPITSPSTTAPPTTAPPTAVPPTIAPPTAVPPTTAPPSPTPTGATAAVVSPTPSAIIRITATEYQFSPSVFNLPAGERVRVTLNNNGRETHSWVLLGANDRVLVRITASAGTTASQEFAAPAAGNYNFICDIADNAQQGMKGTARVQ